MSAPGPPVEAPLVPGRPARPGRRRGLGAGRHARGGGPVGGLGDPLLRNGHALLLSAATTSLVGLAYWALAARHYSAAAVGRDSAAIAAMTFLSGVAELNLMSTLVRFLPTTGHRTRRFVALSYAAAATLALGLAVIFLVVVPLVAPNLGFLHTPLLGTWFVVSTMAGAIFVLQDSVLTGLRATPWVPVENAWFAVVKVALVAALAGPLARHGIFVSWTVAMVIALVPTNAYLFGRAIPRHQRRQVPGAMGPSGAEVRSYLVPDYLASLCWLAATTLMPVLVLGIAGPAANAHFYLAWVIGYTLYLAGITMGASLVVESAVDQSALVATCRRVIVHNTALLVPAIVVVVVAAPELLELVGHGYSTAASLTLRLLAISALPAMLTNTAVSAARALRRMGLVVAILASVCGLVLLASALLLPRLGIAGVGLSWLLTETAVAAVLLARPGLWLPGRPGPGMVVGVGGKVPALAGRASRRARAALGATRAQAAVAATLMPGGGWQGAVATPHRVRLLPTVGDVTVAVVEADGGSAVVVKLPRSPLAAADLHRQCRLLAALRAEPRLAAWSHLLPTMELVPGARGPVALEQFLPGRPLTTLLDPGGRGADGVLRGARSAIAPLHELTSIPRTADEGLLETWAGTPLALVARASGDPHGTDRVARRLQAGLLGAAVRTGWVHGDFTPGNILVDTTGRVTGLVDWGQADPGGLPVLDGLLLALAAECLRSRRELGAVVSSWVGDEEVGGVDPRLLADAGVVLPGAVATAHALVLLCWLRHVAGNLGKSRRYWRHRRWLRHNVASVLGGGCR